MLILRCLKQIVSMRFLNRFMKYYLQCVCSNFTIRITDKFDQRVDCLGLKCRVLPLRCHCNPAQKNNYNRCLT